jgi:2-polyprenyl-3-methyl-5-hydroxy-6-metoxy-1,4-benzoquinol methylase
MQSYAEKDFSYFGNARQDILPLLPASVDRVLEIGCGRGATLAWLKASGRGRETTGIELFEGAASEARTQVGRVLCGPAEEMIERLAPGEQFDLVLCLDVLEHMVDPWQFLQHLAPHLAEGGTLIASIPNVRFAGVVVPLVLSGQWRYRDEGVLDRTHLRFFTRSTALSLLRDGGFEPYDCKGNVPPVRTAAGRLDRLTLGLLREFLAFGWLIAARRRGSER